MKPDEQTACTSHNEKKTNEYQPAVSDNLSTTSSFTFTFHPINHTCCVISITYRTNIAVDCLIPHVTLPMAIICKNACIFSISIVGTCYWFWAFTIGGRRGGRVIRSVLIRKNKCLSTL